MFRCSQVLSTLRVLEASGHGQTVGKEKGEQMTPSKDDCQNLDHDSFVLKVQTAHTLPISLCVHHLHRHCLGVEWVAGSTYGQPGMGCRDLSGSRSTGYWVGSIITLSGLSILSG